MKNMTKLLLSSVLNLFYQNKHLIGITIFPDSMVSYIHSVYLIKYNEFILFLVMTYYEVRDGCSKRNLNSINITYLNNKVSKSKYILNLLRHNTFLFDRNLLMTSLPKQTISSFK